MNIIYPFNFTAKVNILSKEELSETIKLKNGIIDRNFSLPLTARTYLIDSNQYLIEFYDLQGLCVENAADFSNLGKVHFIKKKVEFLHPRISYYIELSAEEAEKLLKEMEGTHLQEYDSDSIYSFQVFELNNKQVIIKYKDGESYLHE